jgi:nitrate/nitrite transport system substrate-binding protein
MRELGLTVPASAYKPHSIMGKTFDPADPDGYVASFAIRRG